MTTPRPSTLWGGLVLVLLACGPRGPALSQTDLVTRIDTLAAARDTTALATLIDEQCQRQSASERSGCYEAAFTSLAEGGRAATSLGALAALVAQRPALELEAHGFAHIIGIMAWKPGEDVGEAFASCSMLFQSGCYHGVIQAYLTSATVDSIRTVGLCDLIAPRADQQWLRFQCVHGLGHGLEMANNWDLPTALQQCDWLHTDWDRLSCYGGAFMENAVASQPGGHHTSATALAVAAKGSADPHAGHGDGGGGHTHPAPDPATITFKMRDPDDPLYPCTAVGERYLFSCYQNQGGILLAAVRNDFAKAAAACDKATPFPRSQCYLSLGTNASGITARNTKQAIAHCSHGDPAYQPHCFVGIVKNYIDVTGLPEDGIGFCREVAAGPNQIHCWVAVGEQVAVLWPTDEGRRREACAAAGDGAFNCRLGARVPETE